MGHEKKRDITEHTLVFWRPEKFYQDLQRLEAPYIDTQLPYYLSWTHHLAVIFHNYIPQKPPSPWCWGKEPWLNDTLTALPRLMDPIRAHKLWRETQVYLGLYLSRTGFQILEITSEEIWKNKLELRKAITVFKRFLFPA